MPIIHDLAPLQLRHSRGQIIPALTPEARDVETSISRITRHVTSIWLTLSTWSSELRFSWSRDLHFEELEPRLTSSRYVDLWIGPMSLVIPIYGLCPLELRTFFVFSTIALPLSCNSKWPNSLQIFTKSPRWRTTSPWNPSPCMLCFSTCSHTSSAASLCSPSTISKVYLSWAFTTSNPSGRNSCGKYSITTKWWSLRSCALLQQKSFNSLLIITTLSLRLACARLARLQCQICTSENLEQKLSLLEPCSHALLADNSTAHLVGISSSR